MKIQHLEDINMGYFAHLFQAWRMGIIIIIHGEFPMYCQNTVSNEIIDSHNSVKEK